MSPEKTRIVAVSDRDFDVVMRIIDTCSRWLVKEKQMKHWFAYYKPHKVRQKFQHGQFFVLYENDVPIGVMHCSTEMPDYLSQEDIIGCAEPDMPALYLCALGILPSHQGQGYAKRLAAHAETVARNVQVKYIRLDARGDYDTLMALYPKLGYERKDVLPDEADGVDYILFEKKIV